jgi:hypothetical protein
MEKEKEQVTRGRGERRKMSSLEEGEKKTR